jgi:molybdate transport repressor ModE-like protein
VTVIDLNDLALFLRVAEAGSISAAANNTGRSKSSVSRSLDRLEDVLGTKLVERSSRGLKLTDAGQTLLDHSRNVVSSTQETMSAISQHRTTPSGHLRVSAPFAFAQLFLPDLLPRFIAKYPEVTVSLEIDNHRVDLLREGFDVAIRVGVLEDSSLVARRLGGSQIRVYAAPTYLEKNGAPNDPQSLADHYIVDVRVAEGERRWTLRNDQGEEQTVSVRPRLCINDPIMLNAAAVGAVGIALLPSFLAEPDVAKGRLQRVLDEWYQLGSDFHVIFSHRRTTPKTRAFVDFLVEEVARSEPWRLL